MQPTGDAPHPTPLPRGERGYTRHCEERSDVAISLVQAGLATPPTGLPRYARNDALTQRRQLPNGSYQHQTPAIGYVRTR